MNLTTGMLKLALLEPRKPRLERLHETVEVRFRVWPLDLDYNLHMNNAKYLVAMELARLALLVRTGLVGPTLRKRWRIVNAAQKVVFFRSLTLFQQYTVSCTILHADDEWLYLKQQVRRRREMIATGLFRMRIKDGRRTVSPRELASLGGYEVAPTEMPPEIRAWNVVNNALVAEKREESHDQKVDLT